MEHRNSEVTLNVAGMTCTGCESRVRTRLHQLGLKDLHVSFAGGNVRFQSQSPKDIVRVRAEIEKLGYSVSGADASATPPRDWLKWKAVVATVFTTPLILHMILPLPGIFSQPLTHLLLALPATVIGLLHFGMSSWRSIQVRSYHMDQLVFIGILASTVYSSVGFILGLGHNYLFFETGASIATFVLIGNCLEQRSIRLMSSALSELMQVIPHTAKRLPSPGAAADEIQVIPAGDLKPGDYVLVHTGDRVPSDSEIISGVVAVDESLISGESVPVSKSQGETVIGGSIVSSGNAKCLVRATGNDTVVGSIISAVQQAQDEAPPIQRLADRVTAYFIPAIFFLSAITLLLNIVAAGTPLGVAIMRAIAVLVIACPCAMGLATPAAVMVGIGRAAREGIIFRGGAIIEALSGVRQLVFDKTGTITTGRLIIAGFFNFSPVSDEELLGVVKTLESYSSHPIARSLAEEIDAPVIEMKEIAELPGVGMQGFDAHGNSYALGSYKIASGSQLQHNHDLFLLKNSEVIAALDLRDSARDETRDVLTALQKAGYSRILLSGDRQRKCADFAPLFDRVISDQSPEQKLSVLKELQKDGAVAYIGDGINDAPALTAANVGISLSEATQVAVSSSDVILSRNSLEQLPIALRLAGTTMRTIRQNLFWAFFYNVLAIPAAACGYLNPTIAAFAMAFSDVIVVANSLRLYRMKMGS